MSELSDILEPLNTSGKEKALKIGNTYPHAVDRQYTADLRKIVAMLATEVKEKLLPVLKEQTKARDGIRNDSLNDILLVINGIENSMFPGDLLANSVANKTYLANEKNIMTSVERSTGIAIRLPAGDVTLTQDWISGNTLLIKDMQQEYLNKINKSVASGFRSGRLYKDIAKDIQKETGITWRRAKLISRNEIGNLNAQINEERNKELGIDTAIWRTMKDERVRGNPSGAYPKAIPSHFKNEGKEFKWSKGLNGELPGQPINCRCFAQSVIKY
jgi:SPP1 gp7 family putative phage head morphogenesis protein